MTNTYAAGGQYSVTQIVDSGSCGTSANGQPNLIWALTPWQIWQNQYFGCIGCPQAAGNVDADGDGISNTNEFLAGTNPTNALSALRITSVVRQANTNIVVTWNAVGGKSYVVQTNAPPANGSYTNNFSDLDSRDQCPGQRRRYDRGLHELVGGDQRAVAVLSYPAGAVEDQKVEKKIKKSLTVRKTYGREYSRVGPEASK